MIDDNFDAWLDDLAGDDEAGAGFVQVPSFVPFGFALGQPEAPKQEATSQETPWLSPSQAAAYLAVSRRTLDRVKEDIRASASAPWQMVGGQVRWHRTRLDNWITEQSNRKGRRANRG